LLKSNPNFPKFSKGSFPPKKSLKTSLALKLSKLKLKVVLKLPPFPKSEAPPPDENPLYPSPNFLKSSYSFLLDASDKTLYASEISLNFFSASSLLF